MKNKIFFCFIIFLSVNVFSQTTVTFWSNGKKKTEGLLKDSVKIGLWRSEERRVGKECRL